VAIFVMLSSGVVLNAATMKKEKPNELLHGIQRSEFDLTRELAGP
jgi:hypothetical protein